MEQLDKVILDLNDGGDLSIELNRAETEFKKQVHIYFSWSDGFFYGSCSSDVSVRVKRMDYICTWKVDWFPVT